MNFKLAITISMKPIPLIKVLCFFDCLSEVLKMVPEKDFKKSLPNWLFARSFYTMQELLNTKTQTTRIILL